MPGVWPSNYDSVNESLFEPEEWDLAQILNRGFFFFLHFITNLSNEKCRWLAHKTTAVQSPVSQFVLVNGKKSRLIQQLISILVLIFLISENISGMEEEAIIAEKLKNGCEEPSYNTCFACSLALWESQINSLLRAIIFFLGAGNFCGFSLFSPLRLFQFYRGDWVFNIFRMFQIQFHSWVQSVFLDSLCCCFWRKEPGIWTGGTGLHIYCAWSFFKVHDNSIGCIFLGKKIACLCKINWIYHNAFHLQQLKTSGLVWGYIVWMDHRLMVNCLQETLPACLNRSLVDAS